MKKVSITDELHEWADALAEKRGIYGGNRSGASIITGIALTGYLSKNFSEYKKKKNKQSIERNGK